MANNQKRDLSSYKKFIQSLEEGDLSWSDKDRASIALFRENIKNAKLEFNTEHKGISQEQYRKQLELINKLCPDKRDFILLQNNNYIYGCLQQMLQPLNIKP